jgi:ribA/ribD-fused uncharacterized protein
MEKYVFFCSHNPAKYADNNGREVFSQWYPSLFKGISSVVYNTDSVLGAFNNLVNGKQFNCCEQWMMVMKTLLFAKGQHREANIDLFKKIMTSSDPSEMKNLGRTIIGFDQKVWDEWKFKIVVNGNYLKFSQNDKLKDILLSTNTDTLVEAAHYDRIWGIGYAESDALANKQNWGQNLLGKALMDVRDLFK